MRYWFYHTSWNDDKKEYEDNLQKQGVVEREEKISLDSTDTIVIEVAPNVFLDFSCSEWASVSLGTKPQDWIPPVTERIKPSA